MAKKKPGGKKTLSADEVKHRQIETYKAYARVFSTPDGKTILKDLDAHFYSRSAVKILNDGSVDMNRTLVNEGARECVLYILNRIQGGNEL